MEYISIKEAVHLVERTDKTIRNWIKDKKIKAEYSQGLRRWRIEKKSLLQFVEYRMECEE